MSNKTIKVVELFAGVGGFRLGLEKKHYEVIWSNQWEPSTKMQHASKVYEARFGNENHSNKDISKVEITEIPDHDLLVGGFPCQDYSVATSLQNSKGLRGKKGVLWWEIHRIIEEKKTKPSYLLLENVDRLLKSPANQRGRDFAVMLQSLNNLGYAVEWRIINAAEYGMPQRRRRIFIMGYYKGSKLYNQVKQSTTEEWLSSSGVLSSSFPVTMNGTIQQIKLSGDLVSITNNFNKNGKTSPFQNSGIMIDGIVHTVKAESKYKGSKMVLGDVLQESKVGKEYYIDEKDIPQWEYLKGAKTIDRKSVNGFVYKYSEGGMIYPDALDNASRTIVTGEGGKTPSRFKHVVKTKDGLRRLTPLELERLNMFPDNHTQLEGISDAKRAFFMGNALVVGIVERIGESLYNRLYKN